MSTATITPTDPAASSAVVSQPVATPSSAEPVASPATPTGGTGASPTPGSTAASPAAPPAETENMRQLRTQYETIKKQLEGYTNLGKPEDLGQIHTQFQGWQKEASDIGVGLGYSPESIQAAFKKDPLGTLSLLRQERDKANPQASNLTDPKNLQEFVNKQIAEGMKPITAYQNQQMTDAANARFEQHFDTAFSTAFPDKDFPADVKKFMFEAVDLAMGYDQEAMFRLKFEGKTADIDKYFDQVKTLFLPAVNSYVTWQSKRAPVPGTPTPTPTSGNKGPQYKSGSSKLDQIIDDPAILGDRYKV